MAAEGKGAEDGAGAGPQPIVVDYDGGSPAFRFTSDGAGFVYYPLDESAGVSQPRVAVCVSKVNSYQKKFFFYDNSSQPHRYAGKEVQIPKTLLCAIDEHIVGHAVAKSRRKTDKIRSFLMSADGATIVDPSNNIIKRWLWDPTRQNAGTAPRDAVELRLNKFLRFRFVDRKTIKVTFKCGVLKMEFDCGEKLRREDTYLQASTSVPYGPLRGKRNIVMDTPTLMKRQQEFFEAMRHKTILLYPDSNRIRHPELRKVMAGLEDHFAPYERKIAENEYSTTPYPTAGWREEALAQTLAEVPQFNGSMTDLGNTLPASFQANPATLDLAATAASAGAGRGGGGGGGGVRLGATARTTGGDSAFGNTMRSTMRTTGGKSLFGQTGGISGIAQEDGRWLGELDVRKRIEARHPILKRSAQLKNASGRYCIDLEVDTPPPAFKKLPVISQPQFDDFLTNVVPSDQLVMVACLREDDPSCRTAAQLLEHVNGTLAKRYAKGDAGASMGRSGRTSSRGRAPYRIVKFDMASSRFLTKRYGIHSLPMYLLFLNAKLVYAGTLGGAKLRMPNLDLKANFMLLEPDAASQMQTEKVLRKLRVDWDLACTVSNAMSHTKRLAENRVRKGPARRYGALATGHAVVMVGAQLANSDVKPLMQTYQRRGRGAGTPPSLYSGAKLLGESLVAICHPMGTVLPAKSMCSMCLAAVEEKKGKHVQPSSLAAAADAAARAGYQAWLCPRCSIVQNPTADLLTGGFGSVAVVKPAKPATIVTLSKLWKMLQAARAQDQARRRTGKKAEAPAGAGAGMDEGAHLGLTHDEVLKQLASYLEAGRRGKFMPPDFKFGLSLSAQDTVYKGYRLQKRGKK